MRLDRLVAGLIICWTSIAFGVAQDWPDWQTRPIIHTTVAVNEKWFLTGWLIGNVREQIPNNFNIFSGFGYRSKSWWLEAMFQRQWREGGPDQWMLDFRFQKQWSDRFTLYVEPAPFLERKALYYFIVGDLRTWKKLNTGFEIENVHQAKKSDSIGAGPRISLPIIKKGKYSFSAALAYQFRRDEANALRFYFVNNFRF